MGLQTREARLQPHAFQEKSYTWLQPWPEQRQSERARIGRVRRWLSILIILLAACGLRPGQGATPRPTVAPASPSAVIAPTTAPRQPPAATQAPAASSTPLPAATNSPYTLTASDVHFEPDPQLYAGDVASIVVRGPGASSVWQGAHAKIFVNGLQAPPRSQVDFGPYGIGNQWQATFTWAWDTTGLLGPQTVYVEVDPPPSKGMQPVSQTLAVPVNILPASARPAPEAGAQWASAESDCCIFHYLTHTAAARDIDLIRSTADAALAHDAAVLGVQRKDKITFTLLSRLLGNGGFTANEVSITYIDRNPAASNLFILFAHEGTHVLDRQIARTRPVMMTEGLAVYVAGGHFKAEPLDARAAGLLSLNRYIPLAELANTFYTAQHEVGYLEAAGFIQYLVAQYGWPSFRQMYGSFNSAPSDAQMLDAALRAEYGKSLSALEAEWLAHLKTLPPDPGQVEDLRLSIALYDTMRRYQQLDDPSAYFLTAWLPDGTEARKRGLLADYIRHPDGPDNITLETMLVAAGQALNAGDYERTGALVDGVNGALDAGSLAANPLAAEQLAVVQQVLADGYEPQSISLDQDAATVEAVSAWPRLEQLTLRRGAGGWQVLASGWLDSLVRFGR